MEWKWTDFEVAETERMFIWEFDRSTDNPGQVWCKSEIVFLSFSSTHRTGWTITGCSLERIHCDTHTCAHLQRHCFTKISTSPFKSLGNPNPHVLKSSVAPYSGTEQSSRTTLCNVVCVREWVCVIRSSLLALHFPIQFKCSQPLSTFRQFKSSRIIAEMCILYFIEVFFSMIASVSRYFSYSNMY